MRLFWTIKFYAREPISPHIQPLCLRAFDATFSDGTHSFQWALELQGSREITGHLLSGRDTKSVPVGTDPPGTEAPQPRESVPPIRAHA